MLKKLQLIKTFALSLLLIAGDANAWGPCPGKFPNPFLDVCWECIFPIDVAGITVELDQQDNMDPPAEPFCLCPIEAPPFTRPGFEMTFWEPARVAEVVRTPMCFPTLSGAEIAEINAPHGNHHTDASSNNRAFYHVHWLNFPLLTWFSMLMSTGCMQKETGFDITYVSEFDIMWDDDELTNLLNPEAILFGNPIAQLACAADTISAAVTNFGLDALFWCSGSHGSVYPLDGNFLGHTGAVDTSLALVHREIFKLTREGLVWDTSIPNPTCGPIPTPILKKSTYKQQMIYPVPVTYGAFGFGKPSVIWSFGKEYPYKGEDFAYLIWRKRRCCVL